MTVHVAWVGGWTCGWWEDERVFVCEVNMKLNLNSVYFGV